MIIHDLGLREACNNLRPSGLNYTMAMWNSLIVLPFGMECHTDLLVNALSVPKLSHPLLLGTSPVPWPQEQEMSQI